MPRKRAVPALTSQQARYILEKLIDEKTVTAADIRRHLSGMWEEMSALEKRISELRGMAEPLRHPVRAAKNVVKKVKRVAKRVSAERLASQKIQGQYLGLIRQIAKRDRPKYQKIAQENGRESAISAMKKTLGK